MPTILLAGCAIIKEDKILLIKKKDRDFWELPGGIVKTKVDLEQAAVDKTKEQIGVDTKVVQQFTILEYQKDGNNMEANIFECNIDPEADFLPGENIEEVRWFAISDLKNENLGDDVKAILEEME